jgi:hypothetical protein
MKSYELLRMVFAKQCVKQIAAGVKLADVTVYKWTEPTGQNGSGQRNPLDVVALLMLLTGDQRLIEWLCRAAGGYFAPNPPVKRPLPATERLPASCRVMMELVNLQAALLGTLPACRCSGAQAEALRGLWDSLKADMERYVRGSEA